MWVPRIYNKSRHKWGFRWHRLEILQGKKVSLKKITAFEQTPCFHWTFTKSKTLGHTWVLGESAWGQWSSDPGSPWPQSSSHMHLLCSHISPTSEQTGLRVIIILPELLKLEDFWLQSSQAQWLCHRKGGSGSFLQPPREINVFEYWQSQKSFQLDCRKLKKS